MSETSESARADRRRFLTLLSAGLLTGVTGLLAPRSALSEEGHESHESTDGGGDSEPQEETHNEELHNEEPQHQEEPDHQEEPEPEGPEQPDEPDQPEEPPAEDPAAGGGDLNEPDGDNPQEIEELLKKKKKKKPVTPEADGAT